MNGWEIFGITILILGFLALLRFAFSGFLDKKEEGMIRHCPKCRALLILEDAPPGRPKVMCGKVLYYRCPNCNTLWKED